MNEENNKDFDSWNKIKKNIETKSFIPKFQEREVWWQSCGVNIGLEEDGKNKLFERPVLVLRKYNNECFTGIPFTTTVKDSEYYFRYDLNEKKGGSMILSQARMFSAKRLNRRITKIHPNIFNDIIIKYYGMLLKIETPAFAGESRVPNGNLYLNDSMNIEKKSNESVKNVKEKLEIVLPEGQINIEDLMKVEIKIGKILSVEEVEGSEKLYKLSVDFGELRPRQVLSGIRKFFPNKEDLLSRQFAFITNLMPRKMMGLESEAMILATGEESLALLSPTIETKNGSQMR